MLSCAIFCGLFMGREVLIIKLNQYLSRTTDFPTSLGSTSKAHDTALVLEFLEGFLAKRVAWFSLHCVASIHYFC